MNTLLINYLKEDGTIEKSELIKRVSREHFNDFKKLLEYVLAGFLETEGCIGEIVNNPLYYDALVKLFELLPIVGNAGAKLDAPRLIEDYDQLRTLVFTTTEFDEHDNSYDVGLQKGPFKSSRLATLHAIDYTKVLRLVVESLNNKAEETQTQAQLQTLEQTVQEITQQLEKVPVK